VGDDQKQGPRRDASPRSPRGLLGRDAAAHPRGMVDGGGPRLRSGRAARLRVGGRALGHPALERDGDRRQLTDASWPHPARHPRAPRNLPDGGGPRRARRHPADLHPAHDHRPGDDPPPGRPGVHDPSRRGQTTRHRGRAPRDPGSAAGPPGHRAGAPGHELAARARSRHERRFLAICRAHGIAPPLVNQWVPLPIASGGLEVDFLWPEQRLVVEIDERASHGTTRAFRNDRARDRALSDAALRVIRFAEVELDDAAAVAAAVLRALANSRS
jgi:hypothetical protein